MWFCLCNADHERQYRNTCSVQWLIQIAVDSIHSKFLMLQNLAQEVWVRKAMHMIFEIMCIQLACPRKSKIQILFVDFCLYPILSYVPFVWPPLGGLRCWSLFWPASWGLSIPPITLAITCTSHQSNWFITLSMLKLWYLVWFTAHDQDGSRIINSTNRTGHNHHLCGIPGSLNKSDRCQQQCHEDNHWHTWGD